MEPELFAEVAQAAEKAGIRTKGLLLYTVREHGFAGQKNANTDDLSKFFKYCYNYWKEHEAQRMEEAAKLLQAEKELQERKRRLGMM